MRVKCLCATLMCSVLSTLAAPVAASSETIAANNTAVSNKAAKSAGSGKTGTPKPELLDFLGQFGQVDGKFVSPTDVENMRLPGESGNSKNNDFDSERYDRDNYDDAEPGVGGSDRDDMRRNDFDSGMTR